MAKVTSTEGGLAATTPPPEPVHTEPPPEGGGVEVVAGTPPQYATGWVKQDPVSLAVAVRTNIPDPESDHDWGVMTVDRGGHYAAWDEVAGWDDK